MRRSFMRVSAMVLLCIPLAWSQAEPAQERHAPEPALVGPLSGQSANPPAPAADVVLPYSEPLSPPAIVTRDRATLELGAESERSNTITGTVEVVAGFTDNAAMTSSPRVSDVSYLFAPGIDMRRSTARWLWNFAYYPGFTMNQRFDQRNQSAHDLSLDTTYFLTQHVSLRLRDRFDKTNSLFSGFLGGGQGPAPLPQMNDFVVTPLAQLTSNTGSVDLNYRFGQGSMIGGGSTYYFLNYQDVTTSTVVAPSLVDTRTFSADSFYAHRFSNNQWTGVIYNFQRLMFVPGDRVEVHRALYFYSLPFLTNMSLSLWAGPEYSSTGITSPVSSTPGASVPARSRWSGAGGVAYLWQGRQTSLAAGYSRHISDGGGLAEAVTLQEVNAELRRRLSLRWTASAGMFYSNADPIYQTINAFGQIRTLSGTVGLERRFTDRLAARVEYVRERLQYDHSGPLTAPTNRNDVLFSLSYSFTRPWGR